MTHIQPCIYRGVYHTYTHVRGVQRGYVEGDTHKHQTVELEWRLVCENSKCCVYVTGLCHGTCVYLCVSCVSVCICVMRAACMCVSRLVCVLYRGNSSNAACVYACMCVMRRVCICVLRHVCMPLWRTVCMCVLKHVCHVPPRG